MVIVILRHWNCCLDGYILGGIVVLRRLVCDRTVVKMKLGTRDIVYIGFIAALCAVATTIRIEVPGGAMVHLGSAALFTTSILFGGLYGGLGAAIGSALFDLFGGHTQYIVFSFFIKGLAGLIVGCMTSGYLPPSLNKPTASFGRILVALIIGSIWTAFGYFLAWWFVLESATVAASKIQYSLITSAAGIVVAIVLTPKLQKVVKQLLLK